MLGPLGTGKSTWIRQNFADATRYDLLDTTVALRLEHEPSLLFNELRTLPSESWVVLDEVQKVPVLLDEVQRLMEDCGLRFILCGSSARKLRRSGVNLLAGRAIDSRLFPLVSAEMGQDFNLNAAITTGTLPLAVTGADPVGFLTTYAHTYPTAAFGRNRRIITTDSKAIPRIKTVKSYPWDGFAIRGTFLRVHAHDAEVEQ